MSGAVSTVKIGIFSSSCVFEELAWKEETLLRVRTEALKRAAQGIAESPALEGFKRRVDAALRDTLQ